MHIRGGGVALPRRARSPGSELVFYKITPKSSKDERPQFLAGRLGWQ